MKEDPAQTLLKYFSGPLSAPKSMDVAKFILLNADTSKALGPGTSNNGGNEPSLMGRIFDILSRPNYAVANMAKNPTDRFAFFQGLSGKEKTTFSDVLENYGVKDQRVRALGGLALDIGLDPTTYIPGGAFAKGAVKAGKLLGIGSKALDATKVVAKDKTIAQKLLQNGEPVFPEAFGLPKADTPQIPDVLRRPNQESVDDLNKILNSIDISKDINTEGARKILAQRPKIKSLSDTLPGQLELPLAGIPKNIPQKKIIHADLEFPVEQSVQATKGQLPFKFPDFNLNKIRANALVDKAETIVQKAVEGEPESILRVLPQPNNVKIGAREQKAAAEIVAAWDNTKSTAQLNQKFPETINARQQVKLYYKAVEKAKARFTKPNAPVNKARVSSDAYRIYTAAEKALEAQGLVPRIGTGENVRLSEVIQQVGGHQNAQTVLDEFGNEIKQGGVTWQAIQALRARGAIDETKTVKEITESIKQTHDAAQTSGVVSDGFMQQFDRIMKQFGSASARKEGLSPAGISATQNLIDYTLKTGKSPAQLVYEQKAKMIDDIVAKGQANNELTHATTLALEPDLGKLPKWVVNDNKAVEFLMGRVSTWWGQNDLRPMSLNAIGSGFATAAARGQALDNLFKTFDQIQRSEAMRLAQGIGTPSTPETEQLAVQITKMMDNLVGQVSGQSVVLRSTVHMDHLNKWMHHYKVGFTFTNKTAKDIAGEAVDFSKGTDWLKSWKVAEIKEDPKIFLFKFQQAMEQATREKALFDEIGERFGAKAYGKEYKNKIGGYPYLDGYYFPDDIAKQIPRVVRDWSLPGWEPRNPAVKLYDRVLSMWKTGVTIYRPAHHIRNIVGDVYLGWMDGVNSVRPYMLAARVQRSMKGAYDTLENVDQLVQLGIMGKGFKTPLPGEVIFKNKSGVEFTAEQIGAVAHQKGLLEHASTLEDIIDMGEMSKFKPLGGRVQKTARGVSELQNHNARLAHFIDKIMKSRGSDLQDIFEQAARRARKWHPSGLDLTEFEKKVMRRIIPFYSWIRKSTPLLLEGLIMNPSKALIPSKIYGAIQEANGIETPGRADPFPVDQMFPAWIRAEGVGPISTSTGFLGGVTDQMPPGYAMGGMGLNPLSQLVSQIETPGKTITSSLTPALRIPIELMTGRKLFTGEPISGPEARPGAGEQYLGEQIPIYSALQGITGITPFGTETKRSSKSSQAGFESFFNTMTGAGVKGTGPYIGQGQYERLAPLRAQRTANKDAFLKYLREQIGNQ
jgi:hypothetical protein